MSKVDAKTKIGALAPEAQWCGVGSPRRAVVDIGSNSVRLVIYAGPPRAPIAIFNEKVLCGLGRSMTSDNRLNPDAVASALQVLSRFHSLTQAFDVQSLRVIATAAVREAADGEGFIAAIGKIGFKAAILSGVEEARLAGLGVISFTPDADGIAGDMGGGSLELMRVSKGKVFESVSLPLGPLSLIREAGADMKSGCKGCRFDACPGAVSQIWRGAPTLCCWRRLAGDCAHPYEFTPLSIKSFASL